MAHHAREAARIIAGLKDRIERLEDEKTTEAVPNPLRDVADTANASDAVSTDTGNRGDMVWGVDNWAFAEWDDPTTGSTLARSTASVAGMVTDVVTGRVADANLFSEVFGSIDNVVVATKTGLHTVSLEEAVSTTEQWERAGRLIPSDPIFNVTKSQREAASTTDTVEMPGFVPQPLEDVVLGVSKAHQETVAAVADSVQPDPGFITQTISEVVGATDSVTKPVIVDSFEDSDLSEYSGATADFSTQNEFPTKHGTVALGRDAGTGTGKIESQSGLNAYPQQGDIFKYYIRFDSGVSEGGLRFAYSGTGDHYRAEYDETETAWELVARSGGTETALDRVQGDQTLDAWYEVKVTWDDGTLGGSQGDITMEVTDVTNNTSVGTASINDTNHTSGGILWYSWLDSSTQNVYYDYAHITNRES